MLSSNCKVCQKANRKKVRRNLGIFYLEASIGELVLNLAAKSEGKDD